MEKYSTLRNKKDYDNFILEIPKHLEYIKKRLNISTFLYNEQEAVDISKFIIENNQDITIDLVKSVIAYFGESIIKRYGGEWFFTGSKDDFSPNEAAIGNSDAVILRHCPINFLYDIIDTKNVNLFNEILDYNINKNRNIDELFSRLFPKKK